MSGTVSFVSKTVERLKRHDPILKKIELWDKWHTDAELADLTDCLLAHPDVATHLFLSRNRLTDETGDKLAQYVAASSTIEWLSLSSNQFGEATYLALAAALRVNSSLQFLYLYNNQAVDQTRIDAAFVDALRLNPVRPTYSEWQLYSSDWDGIEFKRLKGKADELGHPPSK